MPSGERVGVGTRGHFGSRPHLISDIASTLGVARGAVSSTTTRRGVDVGATIKATDLAIYATWPATGRPD